MAINHHASGLNATAHRTQVDAFAYLRQLYAVPDYLALQDVLGWIGANSDDDVLVDYDEIT
ncbi:hypothetical protein [Mycolicibacterium palauense]|uniref:hypothetical protein n=1 Tax=Mycolicibacterium palauense TaxID=2034511 RepID=UPI000BFEC9A8|nr:hypothetical protein [Mycolicibacterium palauense]